VNALQTLHQLSHPSSHPPDTDAARFEFQKCELARDPFAKYGAALLALKQNKVEEFRRSAEEALRAPDFADCEPCMVMAERDLGMSYLLFKDNDQQKAQQWLMQSCELYSHPRVLHSAYLLFDNIYPCALLTKLIGRNPFLSNEDRTRSCERVILSQAGADGMSLLTWW
jgi:hypothetical protein